MKQGQLRIVCPSRQLGYLPCPESNFRRAVQAEPDYYCWNSGLLTPDPGLVGVDASLSLYDWQKHDLELALLAARHRGIPLLIGTAGDTGANSRVDLYVECLRHLARKHNLPPFTLAYFYAEVSKSALNRYAEQPIAFSGHDAPDVISDDDFERTDRILAIAGVHPYLRALEARADVIVGGRSCQAAPAAAAALHQRLPAALAYSLGALLARAGYAVAPDQALAGDIADDAVRVSLLGGAELSACSVAAAGPCEQDAIADGMLDLSGCDYRQIERAAVEMRGAAFFPVEQPLRVRVEGVGKIGERYIGILRVADVAGLEELEQRFEWTRAQIADHFTGKSYQLTYHAYEHHPPADPSNVPASFLSASLSASSGAWFLLIEGIAETGQLAEELTLLATRLLLSASEAHSGGNAVLTLESMLAAPPIYRWTFDHMLPVTQPHELFDLHVITVA